MSDTPQEYTRYNQTGHLVSGTTPLRAHGQRDEKVTAEKSFADPNSNTDRAERETRAQEILRNTQD